MPIALDGADAGDVDALLARGCVGISLPAGALAGAERLEQLRRCWVGLAEREAPLFDPPGPRPGSDPR